MDGAVLANVFNAVAPVFVVALIGYVWRRSGSRHDAWTDEGCLMLAFFLKPNTFFD